eukprot:scaffold148383_cov18-Tisochrysis_lutea.AAC.1
MAIRCGPQGAVEVVSLEVWAGWGPSSVTSSICIPQGESNITLRDMLRVRIIPSLHLQPLLGPHNAALIADEDIRATHDVLIQVHFQSPPAALTSKLL